ncbi:hypothetical protein [Microbacterium xanthum]|uniref:hypothetical protein n=1 Tax=Microbacterium xanthum TaxID=3079794 RepID=UPI002AD30621|nr:hypothetical protein [Microbacterium sp. KSW-48]MDZ8171046.1 hypothetical protein [Microbacterium sp. KSW-48]
MTPSPTLIVKGPIKRFPSPRATWIITFAVFVIGAAGLAIVFGLAPFSIRASVIHYIALGRIECGVESLTLALRSFCPAVGGDEGGLFATNVPVILTATLLTRMLLIPAEWSYFLVCVAVIFGGLVGTYFYARRFAVRHWLALVGAFAYCGSLTVFGFLGFGGMLFGAMMLPVLAAIVGWTYRCVGRSKRMLVVSVVAWFAVTCSLIFADGYTFMMSCLLVGAIVLSRSWGRWNRLSTWIGIATFGASVALSYLIYRYMVPNAGAWGVDTIDKFRAFGLDLATLFVPSNEVWWAEAFGLGFASDTFWGDGSNAVYNYVGVVFVLLAVGGLIIHPRSVRRDVVALVLAGLGGLVLALGPALKIAAAFDPALSDSATIMPAGAGLLELPTRLIYEHVPGFEYMRSTYRWILVTKLALILLALIAVERLLRRRRTAVAVSLIAIALLEVSFNPIDAVRTNVERASVVQAFDRDVVEPMNSAIDKGSRVVMVSGTLNHNDYLSVYLAPRLDIQTWNIGNDKALRRARAGWPEEIDYLIGRQPEGEAMKTAAADMILQGRVDAVVTLNFDLRNNAKSWPPSDTLFDRGEAITAVFEDDPRFSVERDEYFSVVTLSSQTPN